MNLPTHPASVPFVAVTALTALADANGDSGERTVLGALLVLAVIGLVIGLSLLMGRARA